MSTALIVVDMQHDFIDGTLAVPNARSIINKIIASGDQVDFVAFTGDAHPPDHVSFSDKPKFVDKSWPVHCVRDSYGASIDGTLLDAFPSAPIFYKGTDKDVEEYSGFAGRNHENIDLATWLHTHGVELVVVCGLALDFCVKATAVDSVANGFRTALIADATRPVSYDSGMNALGQMLYSGVEYAITDETVDANA